jgi:hypothetical protein
MTSCGTPAWLSQVLLGMTVWFQILIYRWVLNLTGAVSSLFLYPQVEPAPDLHRTEFNYGFRFSPAGAAEI